MQDWQWLVGVVGVPALGWMASAVRTARAETAATARDLAAYKLEVAEKYASIRYLKDVEGRLAASLERIEKKLDAREVNHG